MTHVEEAGTRRRVVWLLIGVLVIAAVIAAVALTRGGNDSAAKTTGGNPSTKPGPSSTATQPTAGKVASFSGDGDTITKSFSAALNWELRWTAQTGSGFTVELLKADGTSRGKLLTAGAKTSGSTFVGEAGSFKLKVTSKKPWTIQVFSVATKK